MAEGDIWYSNRAGRFYQEGRRGAVSNDIGVRSLIRTADTEQFIDSRGRTIPETVINRQSFRQRDLIAYDAQGRPFVTSTIKSKVITEIEAAKSSMDANQSVMLRTVVTTPDGTTHIFYYPGKSGQNVDPEQLKAQAAKDARSKLIDGKTSNGKSYSISTNDIKNSTISSQFIKRTVNVRK